MLLKIFSRKWSYVNTKYIICNYFTKMANNFNNFCGCGYMCGRVMGKKSRKQQQVESKVKLCHSLIDKKTCQLVDTLLESK